MILTKTPLRVSFFGGGTDLPEWYCNNQGAVLSTTIDTYMYITINNSPRKRVKACYDEIEIVDTAAYLNHNRIRESLLYHNIESNIEIASFCSTPTKGTGLGSSSAYTVGLCNALATRNKKTYTKYELAETAFFIERQLCNENLGKQDQYASAFGGLNLIKFYKDEVEVIPLSATTDTLNKLQENLLFFFTNSSRVANDILKNQSESIISKELVYREMTRYAFEGVKLLKESKIDDFGALLNNAWVTKKKMSDMISTSVIDEIYEQGLKAGALGGKLLGAGKTGFVMFYAPLSTHNKIREKLSHLREFKMRFSNRGSEVTYAD